MWELQFCQFAQLYTEKRHKCMFQNKQNKTSSQLLTIISNFAQPQFTSETRMLDVTGEHRALRSSIQVQGPSGLLSSQV